jgi:hypothetical protein
VQPIDSDMRAAIANIRLAHHSERFFDLAFWREGSEDYRQSRTVYESESSQN